MTICKMVNKALVESLLRYGIINIACGGANKSTIKQLQVAQNTILRIVLNENWHYRKKIINLKQSHIT